MTRTIAVSATRRGLFARLSSIAGSATLLAACGQATSQTPTGTNQATTGKAGLASTATGSVEIWQNTLFAWDDDIGRGMADAFREKYPKVTLDISTYTGNGAQKFATASAAGSAPDLYSGSTRDSQQEFVDGLVISLEPYLKVSKILRKPDIWEALRRDVEFKGQMTSIPYAPDLRLMYIHSGAAKQSGVDPATPPKTWSALEEAVGRSFKGSSGHVERFGFDPFLGSGNELRWMVPYWQLGGELMSPDQSKVTLFNERAVQALTWLKKLIDSQGGWEAMTAFKKGKNHSDMFINGEATFYYATNSIRAQELKVKAPDLQYNFSDYPLPDRGGRSASFGGCHAFPIAKEAKNPDGAWLFIEHVTSPENNLQFALRYDRVPIRATTAKSQAYIQGDPFKVLVANIMAGRKWLITAPGGAEARKHQLEVVEPIMSGKMSIQDTLKEKERLLQEVLDKYRQRAEARGL